MGRGMGQISVKQQTIDRRFANSELASNLAQAPTLSSHFESCGGFGVTARHDRSAAFFSCIVKISLQRFGLARRFYYTECTLLIEEWAPLDHEVTAGLKVASFRVRDKNFVILWINLPQSPRTAQHGAQ